MLALFKFLFLQTFWYLIVDQKLNLGISILFMILMLFGHYLTLNQKLKFKTYIIHTLGFFLAGVVFDSGLIFLELINQKSYHLDLLLLWPAFYIYFDLGLLRFDKYRAYLKLLIGAIGGLFTYYMGVQMDGFELLNPTNFYVYTSLFWGVFFVGSLKFVKKSYL